MVVFLGELLIFKIRTKTETNSINYISFLLDSLSFGTIT